MCSSKNSQTCNEEARVSSEFSINTYQSLRRLVNRAQRTYFIAGSPDALDITSEYFFILNSKTSTSYLKSSILPLKYATASRISARDAAAAAIAGTSSPWKQSQHQGSFNI